MSSIHTLNSKGEFPLYVNPFDCPCRTCLTYIGEEENKEYPCLVGAGAGWNYRGPQPRSWESKSPSTEEEPFTSPPPPAVRLVRVNAFATASTPQGGAGAERRSVVGPVAGPVFEEEEAELTSQLKSYRLTLLNQREDVYCMTPDSDDEANLQTTTWDTLTEKIRATDALLAALHQ
jgi:hypothetical protein